MPVETKEQLSLTRSGLTLCGGGKSKSVTVSRPAPAWPWFIRALVVAAISAMGIRATAGVVFTTLHSFNVYTNGSYPRATLVQGSDGNLYGTAGGGTNNSGVIFSISTNGALTLLYTFSGGIDGGSPFGGPLGGLVPGGDGNLYGTTWGGGTNGLGTVFKVSPSGALTSLYSFTGGSNGANPSAGLVLASDGNFYGTTSGGYNGGPNGNGTVFQISASGAFSNLYSFTGGNDGAHPWAALVQGTDGDFYGTTEYGGNRGTNYSSTVEGTVFKISATGALTTLYTFTRDSNGQDSNGGSPVAGLVQASDGNFYGTTEYGGANNYGTVFKINASGSLTTLHLFTGINDGEWPQAGLVQGSDGNLYGTTWYGGLYGSGTVFKIDTNGVLTSLHYFTNSTEGGNSFAALAQGSDGNFYGTTADGGGQNVYGTVFKISAGGVLTTLYYFTGSSDGASPQAGLVQGSDGAFYGTTGGTVFKISANGSFATLHAFTGSDGAQPRAAMVQGSDGNFYGTTAFGGTNDHGTIFRITANGVFSRLYSFTGGNDGRGPNALVQGNDGNFYGTCFGGGLIDHGTVFKFNAGGTLTSLYSFTGSNAFTGSNGGAYPMAGLVQGSDGNFYGTTVAGGTNGNGTVFKVSPAGAFTNLYTFSGWDDGGSPQDALVEGGDGAFYGTTQTGGTMFKITATGALTTLHTFRGGTLAAYPGPLVLGSDGNFYGTSGVVYKITTNGTLTILDSQDSAGGSALVQGSDGNFYGTTAAGGMGGNGSVFKLSVGLAVNPTIQTADGNFGVRTNRFGFDIIGRIGSVVVVEATTNPANLLWKPLATNTLNDISTYFSDPQWTNYPGRFYRLQSQ